jgi:hypothetical protein
MRARKFQKTASRKKKMARQSAARALQQTEVRLGIDGASSLKGITPNPLIAEPHRRTPKTAPTSNRIPGSVAAKDLLHEHKWKEGAQETEATVREMRRKAAQIAPAYNKGALQYLPNTDTDKWPSEDRPKRK